MLIRSFLFDQGGWSSRPGLLDILKNHLRTTLDKISRISSLDEMNDRYLDGMVRGAIVEPIVLHTDQLSREFRSEEIDASMFPFGFNVYAGKRYPKQVARISVPFSGDAQLFKYTPSKFSLTHPIGQLSGQKVQFDIILWGESPENVASVQQELSENLRRLQENVVNSTNDVVSFNQSLPGQVKEAFLAKLDQLTRQHSIFDNLGIKEAVVESHEPDFSAPIKKPKKPISRPTQIIQYIEKQFVQQLNQTNNNAGDVNNAIQSDQ